MPKVGVNFRRRSPLRRGQFCTPVYTEPAHRTLDDIVEHLEAGIDRVIHPAPDERIGIGKREVQASDDLGHAAMLAGAAAAVQFHGMSSSQREAGHPLAIFSMTSAM